MPRPGVGALTLRSGTDSVTVGFSFLPAAAEGTAVVEVETASVHVAFSGGSGARGTGRRRRTSDAVFVITRMLHNPPGLSGERTRSSDSRDSRHIALDHCTMRYTCGYK